MVLEHTADAGVYGRHPAAARLAVAVVSGLLLLVSTPVWAQPQSTASQPASTSASAPAQDKVLANPPSSASGSAGPAPTSAASSAMFPITQSTELLAERVNALTKAFEAHAAAAKPPSDERWQDVKSLILNIISNRIDDFLFGDGKGGVGFAAQLVALLAFIIAVIRLILAIALINPATPSTKWGDFKAWTRKSWVVRAINVVVGALAVLFTGAALYVVVTARASPEATQSALSSLQSSLDRCQASLATGPAARPTVGASAQPSAVASPALEALVRDSNACQTAVQTANARLTELERVAGGIAAAQPWTTTKVLAFLAWLYLLTAVTYLAVKRVED